VPLRHMRCKNDRKLAGHAVFKNVPAVGTGLRGNLQEGVTE